MAASGQYASVSLTAIQLREYLERVPDDSPIILEVHGDNNEPPVRLEREVVVRAEERSDVGEVEVVLYGFPEGQR